MSRNVKKCNVLKFYGHGDHITSKGGSGVQGKVSNLLMPKLDYLPVSL